MYYRARRLRVCRIDLPTRHMWRRRTVPLSPFDPPHGDIRRILDSTSPYISWPSPGPEGRCWMSRHIVSHRVLPYRMRKAPADLFRKTEMIHGRLAAQVTLIAPAAYSWYTCGHREDHSSWSYRLAIVAVASAIASPSLFACYLL